MAKKQFIREQLGLSQQQLADYLGISRALLSLVEANQRSLPTNASIKETQLIQAIQHDAQEPLLQLVQFTTQQNESFQKILLQRKAEVVYELALAKRKLKKLELQYQQAVKALHTANYLLSNLPIGAKNKLDKLWLELLLEESMQKLEACGEVAQQKLQLKIKLLEKEMALLLEKIM